jgi:hypothetical protein
MCGSGAVANAGTGAVRQYTTQQSGAINVPAATTQVAAAHDHGSTAHAHIAPKVPPSSPVIQQYLAEGSYGPTVKKGKAKTIQIEDGKGFGNVSGRKQNDGDKKQNNYSETDANFFPTMGVLMDVQTGKPMNYVKQVQAYNAVGYISTFHPDVYQKMVDAQDAGQGTVLGMALNLMGVEGAQVDPGMQAAALQSGMFATEQVPGSPLNALKVVMSGEDITGQQWARPHHAESSWAVYKGLVDAGLDWKSAMVFSGDDAISGSGRMNGFNNQDGKDGFNDDEAAVFRMIATAQQSTGIPVFDIVAGGHSHTGIDASAKKKPNINKLIGLPHDDMSSSPDRMQRIRQALLDGTVESKQDKVNKFKVKDKGAFKGAGGDSEVIQYTKSAVLSASGNGDKKVDVAQATTTQASLPPGGGAGAPDVPVGGGCSSDPKQGASLLGGGGAADMGSIAAVLQQLVQALNALVQAIGAMSGVGGISGGGGKTTQQTTPPPVTTQATTPATSTQQASTVPAGHEGHTDLPHP